MPDGWVELRIEISPADADLVAEVVGRFAPGSVAIEPVIDPSDDRDFTYELPDRPGLVRAFLRAPLTDELRTRIEAALGELALVAPAQPRFVPVEVVDWSSDWRRFFRAEHIGERIVISPSWEDYRGGSDEIVIQLDPGAAFGTGQHPTTRLCIAALEQHVSEGSTVLDLGTGSGVLAVVAARLGAGHVWALDNDPQAVEVARENARRCGVEVAVQPATGSLGKHWPADWPAAMQADLLVANISSAVLLHLMMDAAAAIRPGGALIASGFLRGAVAELERAAAEQGLITEELHAERSSDGADEWCCLVARRTS